MSAKLTEEQKDTIITEYKAATADRKGAEVAKKHDVTPNTINSWMRSKKGNGASNGHRKARRSKAPVQNFTAALDDLMAYHQGQIEKLQKLRESYET